MPAPERPSPGAAAAPLETSAGGEVPSAATVSECPRSLGGAEDKNRVIVKACGVVPVNADYHVNNSTLTLEAGATLAFAEGTSLNVGYNASAKLIVRGTAEEPVRFTSAGDKVPGAWKGVRLFSHADRSAVTQLIVEYAGADGEAVRIDGQDIVWESSTVRAVKGVGVAFGRHGTVERFAGNRFETVGRWPLSIGPAAVGGIDGLSQFEPGALVHVYGGTIVTPVTWRPAGAPYFVSEDVHVEGDTGAAGSLTLVAGTEVRFGPEARIAVGFSKSAALIVAGSQDAPVLLTGYGERRPGSWPGVIIGPLGEGSFVATIFELGGSTESPGVLRSEGTTGLGRCVFRENVGGVTLSQRAKLRGFDGNVFERNSRAALSLWPPQLGEVGGGNRYGVEERIELAGGTVEESATWHAQEATIEVLDDVLIDGRTVLTIEAGARLAMKDKAAITVGTRDNATLRLMGMPEQPIHIVGLRDADASWAGIRLDVSSRDSVIEHVRLKNAGAVVVAGDANAKIIDLTCERCGVPALRLSCGAQVMSTDVIGGQTREACTVDGGAARGAPGP